MLLTVTTTHEPATDLGYLLVKHPDRVHRFDLPSGTAHVCFPEATPTRCTAALILEVDPSRLTSGRRGAGSSGPEAFTLGQFVNDRPYAASSLLAAALNRALRSAMRGDCPERPELAETAIPLEVAVPVMRCRGGASLAEALFAPLGWAVRADAIPLDETHPEWGESRFVDLTLTGVARLADALNQLYVLLPVLDDAKHYWVAPDEVEKLLRAGGGWLADHPELRLITQRYLAHRRALATHALAEIEAQRLAEVDDGVPADSIDETATPADEEEGDLPAEARRVPLAEQRRRAVLAALAETGPTRVLDLGCGSGALLADLLKVRSYTEVVGVDVSPQVLTMAERRLRLDRLPAAQRDRVRLWQSALTYTDDRLKGFDAAVLMEVIEHVDLPRLPAVGASVFGHARPARVIVTTPNVEYNAHYEGLGEGKLRHHDHRFEWSRAEFAAWAAEVCGRYGYRVDLRGVGETDPAVGSPTQMAVFDRQETTVGATPAVVSEEVRP
jgi:3' terminal RNA ribose 2'-O-methyltransferase Hen1